VRVHVVDNALKLCELLSADKAQKEVQPNVTVVA
jgi:hypothetical protein